LFKKLINNGVFSDQSFSVQNKIRIFNVAVLIIVLINLSYLTVGIVSQQLYDFNFIFIVYIAVLALIFLVIRANRSVFALHLMMICGLSFIYSMCVLFGEKADFHVIFLFILIGSVVFGSRKYTVYYFLAAMLCMVGAKIMYSYFEPFYPDAALAHTGVFNLAATGILIYFSMARFRAELSKNHKKLSEKNKIIESQQEKIIDSINYAKHIQQSILVEESEMQKHFPQSFIYYQPKDIVSGDFYWLSEIKKNGSSLYVVAVADCTGHGVPGAFLSMIGNMLLNKIVNEKDIIQPALILKELHNGILDSLHRENNPNGSGDGMDIAICTIDPANQTIAYAGAMNPLYVLRKTGNGQMEIIHADSQSIGSSIQNPNLPAEISFTNHTIAYEKEMAIYLFSDGYIDQFNAERKRRFGSERFRNILTETAHLPMQEQKEKLIRTFNEWSGEGTQLDDVLVMGLKI